ncbi:MAG: VanZ family protein [Planctomycetota bacterium]|jgi:VanZ family protein
MQKLNDYFEIKWLVLAATLTAIVLVLTHIPQELAPSQLQAGGLDKILHATAYGAITLLLVLSVKVSFSMRPALLVLFVLLGVGSLDEITQPLVRRQASFGDLLANAVGILAVLSLSIVCARRLQRLKVESVSRLCFTAAVAFFAGVLVLPVALVPLSMFIGPDLQEEQKEAYSFFYRTMHELFEGNYNSDKGTVSEEALLIFSEHGPRLGDKCQWFIYDSLERQRKGYFFGPAFFPSGDMFVVRIERVGKRFTLKEFSPWDWEEAWMELLHSSEQNATE